MPLKIDERDEAFRHWFGLQSKMPYRNPEEIAGMGFYAGIAWAEKRAAANKASALPLPEGWKLVPVEPTEEMIDAALDCQDADPVDGYGSELYYAYKAMLAAAPLLVQPEGGGSDAGTSFMRAVRASLCCREATQ